MKFINIVLAALILFVAYRIGRIPGLIAGIIIIAAWLYFSLPGLMRAGGRRAYSAGDYTGAKKWFERSFKARKASADAKIEYAYLLMRLGEIDEAQAMLNELLRYKLKPQVRANAIIQRCMCLYKKGELDEAIKDAKELYDEDYRSINLYGLLGYFRIISDPLSDETYNFCMEAYEYADDNRDICDNMLICMYNHGEYKEAKKISDKVIEGKPKFIEAWYHAAQIDVKLGEYEAALEKLGHIKDCNRSFMTTVSEAEITDLEKKIRSELKRA